VRVAVIGAGMTGLVAAHRLAQSGHTADVYERWPGLGGQVATLDIGDGHLLERYYHHLFTSDRHIASLYEELGMTDGIEWLPSSVAIFTDSRSWPFTTPLDLLRFRPMSLRARLRMGLAVVLLQRRGKEVEPYEQVTARAWIERAMGREAWEKVWGPLLRGKFGDRADDISMAWLWSKLTLRRQIKGEEARKELLGYPHGGWQPLLERLREQVAERGGQVLIDRPVVRISLDTGRDDDGSFALEWGEPDSFRRGLDPRSFPVGGATRYDAVLATVPNDIFKAMLDEQLIGAIGNGYLTRLDSIEYHNALCLLLELDRQFTPFYWTNVADLELPFVGLIEQTNLIPPERYGGRRFLYLANYLEQGDDLLGLSAEELLVRYEPGLRRVNPGFSRDWVKQAWLFREPHAQPIVEVGYRERMPPVRTPVPGLYLANTTQIYPEDRGTNYSVRLGDEAVDAMQADLAGDQRPPQSSNP
jgi:protoporphyrinogen oxidase